MSENRVCDSKVRMPRSQRTLRIYGIETYIGGRRQLVERLAGAAGAIQQDRLALGPPGLQEAISFACCGRRLQDVGVAGHKLHVALRHDLGHHRPRRPAWPW